MFFLVRIIMMNHQWWWWNHHHDFITPLPSFHCQHHSRHTIITSIKLKVDGKKRSLLVFFLGVVEHYPVCICFFWFALKGCLVSKFESRTGTLISRLKDTSKSHSQLGCRRWVAIFFQPKMKTQDPFGGLFWKQKCGEFLSYAELLKESVFSFPQMSAPFSLEPWTLKVIFHLWKQGTSNHPLPRIPSQRE